MVCASLVILQRLVGLVNLPLTLQFSLDQFLGFSFYSKYIGIVISLIEWDLLEGEDRDWERENENERETSVRVSVRERERGREEVRAHNREGRFSAR